MTRSWKCDAQFRVTLEPKEEKDIISPDIEGAGPSDHALEDDFQSSSPSPGNSGEESMGLSDEWRLFRLLSIIGSAAASQTHLSLEEVVLLSKLNRNSETGLSECIGVFYSFSDTMTYQDALIKYFKHAREHPKTPPPDDILQVLRREEPFKGNKQWECSVKGCKMSDTLDHIKAHLHGLTHLNYRVFSCPEW
jgi:hypothetical protein